MYWIFLFVDFIGVFQAPIHIAPSIVHYGIMTVTQCKQACIGGNHTHAMVSNDTCWCGNQVDVDMIMVVDTPGALDRLVNSSHRHCHGNQIQHCPASRDKVDVYSLGITWQNKLLQSSHVDGGFLGVFFLDRSKILKESSRLTNE
jgi:hypothetical protein